MVQQVDASRVSVRRYYREIQPGEIVQISKHGVKSLTIIPRPEGDPPAFCIFEYVYFARPDSIFEGKCIIFKNDSNQMLLHKCRHNAD